MLKNLVFNAKGKKIVDQYGREIIFKGMSLVCKDKSKNYIGGYTQKDFDVIKNMGGNLIRLGITWDGVEPTPGVYKEEYLDEIDKLIALAKKNNIYVYLDMHQDVYGIPIGGGAPRWATLIDGYDHQIVSNLWSDAYITSDACHVAFDNFWSDKECRDGIGIQTHYINMWDYLFDRYKDNGIVIGYDVMNEPFPGSYTKEVFKKILETYGKHKIPEASIDELSALWMDGSVKMDILESLSDIEFYDTLITSFEGKCQEFDIKFYNPFIKRISEALRKYSKDQFLLIEAQYFCNMGVESAVEDMDGVNLIYAPHGYDLVVDTPYVAYADDNRVNYIFNKHKKVQDRLNVPMIIGEWGAYESYEGTEHACEHTLKIFEKNKWSDSFWCYVEGMENWPCYKVLTRTYPMCVPGEILKYKNEFTTGEFTLKYKKTVEMPVIIFASDLKKALKALDGTYRFQTEKLSENSGYISMSHGKIGDVILIEWS